MRVSPNGERVRVLVVDDNAGCRDALAAVVSAAEGFDLVGTADSGEHALELLPQLEPHLVVMDLRMPGLDGIETARRMEIARPDVAVVVVSVQEGQIVEGVAGVRRVLPKRDVTVRGLAEIWQVVRDGREQDLLPAVAS